MELFEVFGMLAIAFVDSVIFVFKAGLILPSLKNEELFPMQVLL